MTGLEKTLQSLEGTYAILVMSKYETADSTIKLAHNSAMTLALTALRNDIEMVEFRITQEQTK